MGYSEFQKVEIAVDQHQYACRKMDAVCGQNLKNKAAKERMPQTSRIFLVIISLLIGSPRAFP